MRDIGGLVWIVFVLFAVISSIVKSARRSRGAASSPNAPVNRAPATPTPVRTQLIRQVQTQLQAAQQQPVLQRLPQPAPPVAAAPIPVAPIAVPPSPAAPQPPPAPRILQPPSPRQARATGLFGDRSALIRGIIAAEVLGKPLALRDE